MARIVLICVAVLVLTACGAQAAELQVGPGYTYATITAAVAAASNGDTVTVHDSTYTEGQINITKANLLLRGAPGETMPKLISTAGQYGNMIVINADGVTIRGLEITHSSGDRYGYGIGDANAGAAHTGWTVDNCVIHDCRSAVWNNKASKFSFTNNTVYRNYGDKLFLEATVSFVCTGNFFHSSTKRGAKSFAIEWYTGSSAGYTGDTVISDNYIAGCWNQIMIAGQSPNTPSGTRTITIAHNTQDGTLSAWYPNDFGSQLIAFWDGSGYTYDAGKITIRDNLLIAAGWYGLVNDDDGYTGGLVGDMPVSNCLFWGNYWKYWPLYQQSQEWFGTLDVAQVGWTSVGGNFVMADCLTEDPLLMRTGTTARTYYALGLGSPALGSATDGTNIGAWQGTRGLDSIAPSSGQNDGPVSITNLAGSGFLPGATVKLTKTGQSDIAATNITVVSSTKITCDFDLTGKALGLWNVVVTNVGGAPASLDNAFTITAPPLPPVANAGPDQTVPVGPVTLDGSGSYDPQSMPLTYVWKEGITQIATGVNPTVPMAHGQHLITLTVTNTAMPSDSDNTTVIVNRPPVAYSQGVYVSVGKPKPITLVATDPDGDPLTYTIVSPPAHGVLRGTPPNVVYTPAYGYTGLDSFTFKANDGWSDSNVAKVSLGLKINCGGPIVGDWRKDQSFIGGQALWSPAIVSGTGLVPVSVDQAQRGGAFSYSIPAPDGPYTVRLSFADVESSRAGSRLFDVYIGNRLVLANFDIFAAAGGKGKAVVREFATSVSGGTGVQIRFVPRKVSAIVAGIDVL